MIRPLRAHFTRLMKAEDGNVLILVGLMTLLLIMAVGAAIDMARAQTLRARMQYALDAAGLAAAGKAYYYDANTMTMDQWVQQQAVRYFNADFPSDYLQSSPVTLTTQISGRPFKGAPSPGLMITLMASTSQSTNLMNVVGINSLAVGSSSEVVLRLSFPMELALVIDNSTPMSLPASGQDADTRMVATRAGLGILRAALNGGGTTNVPVPGLWIGLVPFAGTVNIGTGYPGWMDSSYTNDFAGWAGCVMGRPSPYDVSDDPPSVSLFDEFNDSLQTNPNTGCTSQVMPMTNGISAIGTGISNMDVPVTPNGTDTMADLGMAWAWRLLSPRWDGLWGGQMNANNLPLPYNAPGTQKVVILISSGWNVFADNIYTAYGRLSDGTLGFTDETSAEGVLDSWTQSICSSLKSNAVVIYTIGYGQSVNTTLLQNCATDSAHYFYAPDEPTFKAAMHQLADELSRMRVTQ